MEEIIRKLGYAPINDRELMQIVAGRNVPVGSRWFAKRLRAVVEYGSSFENEVSAALFALIGPDGTLLDRFMYVLRAELRAEPDFEALASIHEAYRADAEMMAPTVGNKA